MAYPCEAVAQHRYQRKEVPPHSDQPRDKTGDDKARADEVQNPIGRV